MILEIGSGPSPRFKGSYRLDKIRWFGVPRLIQHDLEQTPLPFQDQTFTTIYASHVLEHVVKLPELLNELHRIISPIGVLEVFVPFRDQELICPYVGHVRFFTERTFEGLETDPYVLHWKIVFMKTERYAGILTQTAYRKGRHIKLPMLRSMIAVLLSVFRQPHFWQKWIIHVKLVPLYDAILIPGRGT